MTNWLADLTADEVTKIAGSLTVIAEQLSPVNADALGRLIGAAAALNELVHAISQQTSTNAPEVWAKVREDFSSSLDAFEQSRR